ncbi:TolC family protein [Telmatobacter sp. DSM 110680]|uniref:TolC family protein n=1 Tax=Telmatobacter sp. DSM 110680 TaxID=3036704 RepID=A0AAU7DEY9_9BACT
MSLKTVVDLAQKNSTGVRAAMADVNKANAVLSESKDAVIPSVNVGTGLPVFPEVGFTGSPPSIWNATVQSLVYSIPQKKYIDAARFGVQAAAARLKDAREQVALDASTAYIELDAVNQELNTVHQQEQFSTRLADIEQQRTEAGVDATSEMLQAKLWVAEIKLKRLHLEARAAVLEKQLAILTGLPEGSIKADHASIPEIPQVHGEPPRDIAGVRAAQLVGMSKMLQAKGDREVSYFPELRFFMQYNRNTTILNDVNKYFATSLPANNFASGIGVQIPILDMGRRARAKESAADALRSTVEAEQAEKQNDLAIADLSGSIRELDTQAEIASLKQQIADEQLKTVLTQLELGNGAGPGSQPQTSPKAEQLALIDAGQKNEDALDAGFELAKARLNLLRALGHMDDWLHELKAK